MAKCFPRDVIETIKKLNLKDMSSVQRTKAFDEILGIGEGKEINQIYEKTLLLKNQNKAFDRFIDDLSGVSLEKKAKIKENITKRLAEKQDIIKEKELLSLVEDSLRKKYDIDIDDDTVSQMFKLKNEADELAVPAKGTPNGSPEKLAWGDKIIELSDLVDDLKQVGKNPLDELKLSGQRIAGKFKEGDTLGGVGQIVGETLDTVFNPVLKSVKASYDNSVLLRQGLKVISADPGIWKNNAKASMSVWGKVLNKEAMEEAARGFKADLVTRDLYQDAIKSKLAIGVVEDFFPTSVVQKIPGLGNIFKASDEAFTMFSQGSRMDLFEKYVNLYKEANNGAMPTKEIMDGFAKVANSTTGRGGLGTMEPSSNFLNKILFSARYQTANINTFKHALDPKLPREARAIAQKQLAKHLVTLGGIMTTLSAFGDVGWDPRESTFGKYRLNGTKKWVDVTGGLASYFSLIGKTGEATLGKQQFGKDTGLDIVLNFLKGKLAPVPGVARDILEQRDYSGKKPDIASVAKSLFVPITLENLGENIAEDEEALVTALATFLEFFGGSVSEPKAKSEGSYDFIKNN